jgi:uncharacterized membrane protein
MSTSQRPRPLRPPEVAVPTTPEGAASLSSNATNGLIHLYRAEVGRLTAYRARLDTTTSWAISSSALVATLVFGSAAVSHAALLFLMVLNYFFLHLEARRFRYYEVSRYRVHVMERYFYPALLGQPVSPSWTTTLIEQLQHPITPLGHAGALGWRVRRTYMFLFVAVLVAWLSKLDVSGGWTSSALEFVDRAAVGSIPGAAVLAAVAALYGWLAILALMAARLYPLGDEDVREQVGIAGD